MSRAWERTTGIQEEDDTDYLRCGKAGRINNTTTATRRAFACQYEFIPAAIAETWDVTHRAVAMRNNEECLR